MWGSTLSDFAKSAREAAVRAADEASQLAEQAQEAAASSAAASSAAGSSFFNLDSIREAEEVAPLHEPALETPRTSSSVSICGGSAGGGGVGDGNGSAEGVTAAASLTQETSMPLTPAPFISPATLPKALPVSVRMETTSTTSEPVAAKAAAPPAERVGAERSPEERSEDFLESPEEEAADAQEAEEDGGGWDWDEGEGSADAVEWEVKEEGAFTSGTLNAPPMPIATTKTSKAPITAAENFDVRNKKEALQLMEKSDEAALSLKIEQLSDDLAEESHFHGVGSRISDAGEPLKKECHQDQTSNDGEGKVWEKNGKLEIGGGSLDVGSETSYESEEAHGKMPSGSIISRGCEDTPQDKHGPTPSEQQNEVGGRFQKKFSVERAGMEGGNIHEGTPADECDAAGRDADRGEKVGRVRVISSLAVADEITTADAVGEALIPVTSLVSNETEDTLDSDAPILASDDRKMSSAVTTPPLPTATDATFALEEEARSPAQIHRDNPTGLMAAAFESAAEALDASLADAMEAHVIRGSPPQKEKSVDTMTGSIEADLERSRVAEDEIRREVEGKDSSEGNDSTAIENGMVGAKGSESPMSAAVPAAETDVDPGAATHSRREILLGNEIAMGVASEPADVAEQLTEGDKWDAGNVIDQESQPEHVDNSNSYTIDEIGAILEPVAVPRNFQPEEFEPLHQQPNPEAEFLIQVDEDEIKGDCSRIEPDNDGEVEERLIHDPYDDDEGLYDDEEDYEDSDGIGMDDSGSDQNGRNEREGRTSALAAEESNKNLGDGPLSPSSFPCDAEQQLLGDSSAISKTLNGTRLRTSDEELAAKVQKLTKEHESERETLENRYMQQIESLSKLLEEEGRVQAALRTELDSFWESKAVVGRSDDDPAFHEACLLKMRSLEAEWMVKLEEKEERLQSMIGEKEEIRLKLDLRAKEAENLRKEKDEREQQLLRLQESHKSAVSSAEEQIRNLNGQLSSKDQEAHSLQKELTDKCADLESSKDAFAHLKCRVKDVATELKDRRVECRSLREKVEDLSNINDDLNKQISELGSQISEAGKVRAESSEETSALQFTIKSLELELESTRKELVSARATSDKALASYKRKTQMALAAANARSAAANAAREEAEADAEAAKAEAEKARERASIAERSEKERASSAGARVQQAEAVVEDAKDEIERMREKIEDARLHISKLEADSESIVEARDRLLEERETLLSQLGSHKKNNESLKNEVREEQVKNQELRDEAATLREEVERRAAAVFMERQRGVGKIDGGSTETSAGSISKAEAGGGSSSGAGLSSGTSSATEAAEETIVGLQHELRGANEAIIDLKEALRLALTRASMEDIDSQLSKQSEKSGHVEDVVQSVRDGIKQDEKKSKREVGDDTSNERTSVNTFRRGGISDTDSTPLFFAMEKQAELSSARDEIHRLSNLLGDAASEKQDALEAMEEMRRKMKEAESRLKRFEKLGPASAGQSVPAATQARHGKNDSLIVGRVANSGRGSLGHVTSVGGGYSRVMTGNTFGNDSEVNLEYLKAIVLSYLNAKTVNERKALVPVVSAVLCLTSEEQEHALRSVEESGGLEAVGVSLFESLGVRAKRI